MKRVAAPILLAGVSLIACKKHEDASVHAEATQTVAPIDSSIVAATAPTASASAAEVASAAPGVDGGKEAARQEALRQAMEFGMIGLINADGSAPTAPWGRDDSLGKDPLSARGNIWGDQIG